jgi:hypothetical protein
VAALGANADHLAINILGIVGVDVAGAAAAVGHFGNGHFRAFGMGDAGWAEWLVSELVVDWGSVESSSEGKSRGELGEPGRRGEPWL